MGEKIAYVPIHVRLLREQYEFLRKYSYDKRVSKAEVIRAALEMYREVQEAQEMYHEVQEMYSQEKCK
jgi:Arc/MetJ-type ribon-helix-helix transcriptional regulator